MKKIVMVTLDERPCNYNFPQMMPKADYNLVIPPKELMGDKKIPANVNQLQDWLLKNIIDADVAILSLDTLIYGGIVPSRLHYVSFEELQNRSKIIEKVKAANPSIIIYAFQLIMRCPWYSLSDEEPDYYDQYGSEIHRYGRYEHLQSLNLLTPEDEADFSLVKSKLDMNCLNDYKERRNKNLQILMGNLDYIKSGLIDFFIVPQDDSAVYGFTSVDQMRVREYIKANSLQRKISMYPSADDTGLTLLGRAVNYIHNVKPKVYVYYASSKGGAVIPSFEDRVIDETIKFHILSINGIRVYSLAECDILLAVNIGSAMLNKDEAGYVTAYDIERNLAEYVSYIEYAKEMNKLVAVADVAHCNGGDEELVKLLRDSGLLFKVDAYAGWNTSSNTIGTVLAQVVIYMNGKDKKGNLDFLVHRYVEDVGYCAWGRTFVTNKYLSSLDFNYFYVKEADGEVARIVKAELLNYFQTNYVEIYDKIDELKVRMPWRRMFEVEVKIKTKGF
jgi:hypothetical protein